MDRYLLSAVLLLATSSVAMVLARGLSTVGQPETIGATATVTELHSGVPVTARVDTGARTSSLHCGPDDLVIVDPAPTPEANIRKRAKLRVENEQGESVWIETKIHSRVEVSNAEHVEWRYCVELPLILNGAEFRTLVTLNDRSSMNYRMLLGRNFLKGRYLVDVTQDSL